MKNNAYLEKKVSKSGLKAYEISVAKNMVRKYRESFFEMMNKNKVRRNRKGQQVFTVLTPPFGSAVARRRVKFSIHDFAAPGTVVEDGKVLTWGKRTPHVFSIALSYDCQCKCNHCSADKYRKKTEKDGGMMTVDEIHDAIQQGVDLGATIIILTGGEPLMKPEIFDIVDKIDKNKCIPIIFTNGEFLTKEVIERLVDKGLYGLFVSLDSSVPEEHDAWRGRPGLFNKALEGIKLAVEAGLLTGIGTVVTKKRLYNGDLERLMDIGKDLGVMEVIAFDITPAGKLEDMREDLLGPEEKDVMQKLMSRYNSSDAYPNMLHESIFSYFAMPSVQGCPGGQVMVHVRGNGDVASCDGMPIPFANLKDESLESIWDRITKHAAFKNMYHGCRLANKNFVKRYIEGRERFQ